MSIDENLGEITWIIPDTLSGSFEVGIKVTDTKGASDSTSYFINVIKPNTPPLIVDFPDTVILVNETFTYQVEIIDPDEDDIHKYYLINSPSGMMIDESTGLISWTPTQDNVGVSAFEVEVYDDKGGFDRKPFKIKVDEPNKAPVISAISDTSIIQGSSFGYQVNATDDNMTDVLSYTLLEAPVGMNINSESGFISWFPEFNSLGSFSVSVLVSDDRGGKDSTDFTITIEEKPDEEAPLITDGPYALGITENRANISWETNEKSTSILEYDIDSLWNYQTVKVITDTSKVTYHSMALENLNPSTEYRFRVKSVDRAGNESSYSDEYVFMTEAEKDTLPPVILGKPLVVSVEEDKAIIQWKTDELSTTIIEYSVDSLFSIEQNRITIEDNVLVVEHNIVLENLSSGTKYKFRASSIDGSGNGPVYSEVVSFETKLEADITPPTVMMGPAIEGITDKNAVLIWETDEPADAIVEFGLSTAYGNILTKTEKLLRHKINLVDLVPDTIYHFKFYSTDLNNNRYASEDFTFRTKATPDTVAPIIIAGPVIKNVDYDKASIYWKTDEISDSKINYGIEGEFEKIVKDVIMDKEHNLSITGLDAATQYYYYVESTDKSGNKVVSGTDYFTTDTAPDTIAPNIISGPYLASKSDKTARIEWETDEISDTYLY